MANDPLPLKPAKSMQEQLAADSYSLKPGDVVRLKSGGPMMTVSSARGNTVELVYWNEQNSTFETWEDIEMATLEKTEAA